ERAEHRDDDEVRQDERPTAGPGAPEPAPDVGDPDPDLDCERTGQRLADGDPFAHLFLRQPFLFAHELTFHLAHQGHAPPDAEHAEAKVVANQVASRNTLRRRLGWHPGASFVANWPKCNA